MKSFMLMAGLCFSGSVVSLMLYAWIVGNDRLLLTVTAVAVFVMILDDLFRVFFKDKLQ